MEPSTLQCSCEPSWEGHTTWGRLLIVTGATQVWGMVRVEYFSHTSFWKTIQLTPLHPACTVFLRGSSPKKKVLMQDPTAPCPNLFPSLWVQPSCSELMQETCTQEVSFICGGPGCFLRPCSRGWGYNFGEQVQRTLCLPGLSAEGSWDLSHSRSQRENCCSTGLRGLVLGACLFLCISPHSSSLQIKRVDTALSPALMVQQHPFTFYAHAFWVISVTHPLFKFCSDAKVRSHNIHWSKLVSATWKRFCPPQLLFILLCWRYPVVFLVKEWETFPAARRCQCCSHMATSLSIPHSDLK